LKRVLIISPFFPPVNTADMHRIRQSLPYFRQLGWEPVVIAVEEAYTESYSRDELLLQTIPSDIEVYRVKAFKKIYTCKVGLGSLSIRAYFHIRRKGNELLRKDKFDLVYFSTTAFHVMALGPGWKKKFKVPFIVDIQDPWRNDFYLDKPAKERPPKFFFAYNIDKYLEAKTIPFADGIISVSRGYCDTFLQRYPVLKEEQFKVIPFGASVYDFDIMHRNIKSVNRIVLNPDKINLLYIGRGGYDMQYALEIIFKAVAYGIKNNYQLFSRLHLWFIGTSYALAGKGKATIAPIAKVFDVIEYVTEITDRIPYFETLYLLEKASVLILPGSTDPYYTASKIYPYLLSKRPLLAVFNKNSSVTTILKSLHFGSIVMFDPAIEKTDDHVLECYEKLTELINLRTSEIEVNKELFEPLTAKYKAALQIAFFNEVLTRSYFTNV
jgi:hypothetical protein